jgi:hypothetical protein
MMHDFKHLFQPAWMQGAALSQPRAAHTIIFVVKGLLIEVPLSVHIKSGEPVVKSLKMKKTGDNAVPDGTGKPEASIGSYRAFRRETSSNSCEIIACCPKR